MLLLCFFLQCQIHRKLVNLNLNANRWDLKKDDEENIKNEIGKIIEHLNPREAFILEISYGAFGFGCRYKGFISNVSKNQY